MNRPLRAVFLLLLALLPVAVVAAMVVLTLLRSEARVATLRLQTEALMAVDAAAASLVVSEAMRPVEAWRSFHRARQAGGGESSVLVASPLLREAVPPVLLHLEWEPEQGLSSPQVPPAERQELAQIYASTEQLAAAAARLLMIQQLELPWARAWEELPALPAADSLAVIPVDGGASPEITDNSPPSLQLRWANPTADQEAQRRSRYTNEQVQERLLNRSQGNIYAYNIDPEALAAGSAEAVPRVGLSQVLWLGDQLLLLRRADHGQGQGEVVQGAWLDVAAVAAFCLGAMDDLGMPAQLVPRRPDEAAELPLGSLPLSLHWQPPTPQLTAATRSLLLLSGLVAAVALLSIIALVWLGARLAERRAAFVSAVTHELRTPLTALRLHADLLADERIAGDGERRGRSVTTLRAQAARLASLVDNVLDYARLERRRPPQCQPLDLLALLHQHQEQWQERLRAVDCQWHCLAKAETDESWMVRADPDALLRIVDNVVENAVKYAVGSPSLECQLRRQGPWLVMELRDHGPGLGGRALPRPGERSAEDAAGQAPGIGLGLELCRRLARAMGGRLQVAEAQPGLRVRLSLRSA